jgi:hypothetical protein
MCARKILARFIPCSHRGQGAEHLMEFPNSSSPSPLALPALKIKAQERREGNRWSVNYTVNTRLGFRLSSRIPFFSRLLSKPKCRSCVWWCLSRPSVFVVHLILPYLPLHTLLRRRVEDRSSRRHKEGFLKLCPSPLPTYSFFFCLSSPSIHHPRHVLVR